MWSYDYKGVLLWKKKYLLPFDFCYFISTVFIYSQRPWFLVLLSWGIQTYGIIYFYQIYQYLWQVLCWIYCNETKLTCDHIQIGFLGRFSESSVLLCTIHTSEGYNYERQQKTIQQFAPLNIPIFVAPPHAHMLQFLM
jgi:hypothetical protein